VQKFKIFPFHIKLEQEYKIVLKSSLFQLQLDREFFYIEKRTKILKKIANSMKNRELSEESDKKFFRVKAQGKIFFSSM
jgi:hypothetical protein